MNSDDIKAHYIKYHHISGDPALIEKAELLADLYSLSKQQQRKSNRDFEAAFNVILTSVDIFQAYDGWSLYIPTNNNLFSGTYKRNNTYTTEIRDAIKWLISNNYLEKVSGVTRPKKKNSKKRQWLPKAYKLTTRWLSEISNKPLSDPRLIRRNPLAGYWECRKKIDGAKVAVTPSDRQLKLHRAMLVDTDQALEAYDKFMVNVVTSIGTTAIMPAQLSMMRIFSKGSLNQGGRLYSAVQNYKAETRKYLYFDKEPTLEIDYSSFHPHLLYHQDGLQFAGDDPYVIEGFDRDHVKVAFNIMLNRKGSKDNKSAANTISDELGIDIEASEALEAAILTLHSPIAKHFNSGIGLKLQRLDSDIAMSVIDHFVNVLKRPIVSIHDSFIVSVRDTESLILLMADCYTMYVDEMIVMRGIKGTAQEFSNALMDAIDLCFKQQTNGMCITYWDALLFKEGVKDFKGVDVEEEDVSEAEAL
jgi:hypothetical protein